MAKTTEIDFLFLNGPVQVSPDLRLGEQYGGPYYRFFDQDAPHINQVTGVATSLAETVDSPEAFGRALREAGMANVSSSTACDFLERHLEQHDQFPYHGVLGFSEGASIAAALMLRRDSEGMASPFQFAIFICAVPPFRWDRKDVVLPTETTERIRIPTAHILGVKDPGRQASRILYDLCEESSASLSYHKGGHTIPWDLQTTAGIVEAIRRVLRRSQDSPIAR